MRNGFRAPGAPRPQEMANASIPKKCRHFLLDRLHPNQGLDSTTATNSFGLKHVHGQRAPTRARLLAMFRLRCPYRFQLPVRLHTPLKAGTRRCHLRLTRTKTHSKRAPRDHTGRHGQPQAAMRAGIGRLYRTVGTWKTSSKEQLPYYQSAEGRIPAPGMLTGLRCRTR